MIVIPLMLAAIGSEPLRVSELHYVGNASIAPAVLLEHLRPKESWPPPWPPPRDKISPMVHAIEKLYQSFGYFDVQARYERRAGTGSARPTHVFHITEGRRYRVAKVKIFGITSVCPDSFQWQVATGDYYDRTKALLDLAAIKDALGNLGIDPQVHEEVDISPPDSATVAVVYLFRESTPARVGKIKIVGNGKTPREDILQQIPLRPGEVLRYPALRVAESNLARMGLFRIDPETGERPTVEALTSTDYDKVRDILITVKELPRRPEVSPAETILRPSVPDGRRHDD